MNILLIVGNDKLGRRLVNRLGRVADVKIVYDCSSDYSRAFKLFWKGALSLSTMLKMALAERKRVDFSVPQGESITSNSELLDLIYRLNPEIIYLFRAGLIINKQVIATGIPVLNVHCASLPHYGGLGSIERALKDGAYQQEATLHRVTTKIDDGEILATMPYRLDPNSSYYANEEAAYEAGISLIFRLL